MKILVKNNFNNAFPMEIECGQVKDEYGFDYGDSKDFCGSILEIDIDDIKKHEWFKYPNFEGVDYGVKCPVCGKFIVIDKSKIPNVVKANAKGISLNE